MALTGFTIGSGSNPAAPGSSTALQGFKVGQTSTPSVTPKPIQGDTALKGFTALPDPFKTPTAPAIAKPADTSSLFSKFLNFASGVVSKGLNKLGDAIEPPDLTNNPTPSVSQYLPSELARWVPGVVDIQDEKSVVDNPDGSQREVPTFGEYLNLNFDANDKNSDLVNALKIENAPKNLAQGVARMLPSLGLTVWDAGRLVLNKYPDSKLTIPGLGEIHSGEYDMLDAIEHGMDPTAAALQFGANTIFESLFFADIGMRVAAPRSVKVYERTGGVSELPGGQNINSKPKTGRLYETPNANNSGGAHLLPKETYAKLKAQGIKVNPDQPVFQRLTIKGTTYTGEVFQVRPSYLKTAYENLFGKKGPTTVPRLLGEKPPVQTDVVSQNDLRNIANNAPEKEIQIVHSKSVTDANIETAIKGALTSVAEETTQPTALKSPVVPTIAHTVVHNIIRLGQGDTSKAKEGADHLIGDIKKAVAEHGEGVVAMELQQKIGVDEQTAHRLILEAKGSKTPAEQKALHERVLQSIVTPEGKNIPGINPKQEVKLSNEEAAPIAARAATDYYISKVSPAIKEGGPAILGGDDLKDYFGNDYNDNNHPVYSQAKTKMFERALQDKNIKSNVVAWTGGGPGSGKTEIIVNHLKDVGFSGIILDSNFSSYEGAKKEIEIARAAGKEVRVYGVLPNLENARGFTLQRAEEKGRAITDHTFAHGHSQFPATVQRLLEEGLLKPEEVKLLDTRHIDGIHDAKSYIKQGKFVRDALAKVKELAYNKETLKKDYAKDNYEKTETGTYRRRSGQSNAGTGVGEEGNKSPDKDRAGEAGFVATPAKIVEDVAAKATQIKEFIDETSKKIEVSSNTSDDLYKLENNDKRDLEIAIRLTRELKPDPADMEAIYHYEEDKDFPLTEKQKQIYDAVIKPIAEVSSEIFSKLKNAGLPMSNEDYTPRFVKGRGNALDRLMDAYEKGKVAVSVAQGGPLSRTTGSMKHRTMKSIVAEDGERTVVSIKTQQFTTEKGKKVMSKRVTAFRGGKAEDMGKFSTKTKEELLNTEVKPVQAEIGKIQKEIDRLVAQNESKQPVTADMLETLSGKIDKLIEYVDSNVGAFTHKELAPEIRKIKDKAIEFNTLSKVKQSIDQMKIHRSERLESLRGEMVSLVNKLGEIEGSYNPHELNDTVFTDKNGRTYKITEATTKEIERHTNLEYHKNVLANRILQYLKLRQIERANEFVEDFKNDPNFSDIAVKVGEEAPENYRPTSLPQFRGYMLEPRVAEVFDRFNDKMSRPEGLLATLGPINRFLRNAIFFNPLIHVPNITVHWLTKRGAFRLANPAAYVHGAKAFARAWNAVVKKNDDYLEALENGAPLLASEATSRELGRVLLENMVKELEAKPGVASKVANALGYVNPATLIKTIYRFSGKFTWTINDLLTMQAIYEDMDENKISLSKAIGETGKHIPNYRVPERIFDKPLTFIAGEKVGGDIAHGLASMMQNTNLSMFGAYHYGALKSYGEMSKDISEKKKTAKERRDAFSSLIMLGIIGIILYPYVLDKLAQAITGNKNAKFRRAGGTTLPENIRKYVAGSIDAGQLFQSVVTPAAIAKIIPELVWNRDLWNDQQIYGGGGEGFLNFAADQVPPVQQTRNLTTRKMEPISFLASLGGISSPKSTDSEKEVTTMIYGEKPLVLKDVKALVVAGDQEGALEKAREFNVRLKDHIKQSLIDNGKSATPEQVDFIFKKNAVRMPTQKTIDNYNATQGKSFVGKIFAAGQKPELPTGVPMENDSFTHGIAVYANAIVTDPSTALDNILHGQVIRRVDNGTIIIRRMTLGDSQAIKKAGGGDNPTMKLDHTLPLQLGGNNEESNLKLVPTAEWASYTPVENYLGKALRGGQIDKATAQKYMLNFKTGVMSFDDIKSSI